MKIKKLDDWLKLAEWQMSLLISSSNLPSGSSNLLIGLKFYLIEGYVTPSPLVSPLFLTVHWNIYRNFFFCPKLTNSFQNSVDKFLLVISLPSYSFLAGSTSRETPFETGTKIYYPCQILGKFSDFTERPNILRNY